MSEEGGRLRWRIGLAIRVEYEGVLRRMLPTNCILFWSERTTSSRTPRHQYRRCLMWVRNTEKKVIPSIVRANNSQQELDQQQHSCLKEVENIRDVRRKAARKRALERLHSALSKVTRNVAKRRESQKCSIQSWPSVEIRWFLAPGEGTKGRKRNRVRIMNSELRVRGVRKTGYWIINFCLLLIMWSIGLLSLFGLVSSRVFSVCVWLKFLQSMNGMTQEGQLTKNKKVHIRKNKGKTERIRKEQKAGRMEWKNTKNSGGGVPATYWKKNTTPIAQPDLAIHIFTSFLGPYHVSFLCNISHFIPVLTTRTHLFAYIQIKSNLAATN